MANFSLEFILFIWQLFGLFIIVLVHKIILYKRKHPVCSTMKSLNVIRITSVSCESPEVSIIIPAYNEANRIDTTLFSLLRFVEKSCLATEIVIVDDGSTDDTLERCYVISTCYLSGNHNNLVSVTLAASTPNSGKGKALIAGLSLSTAPKILLMDADGATDLKEILRFKKLIGCSQVLCGSRKYSLQRRSFFRLFFSKAFRNLKGVFLGLTEIEDTQCGFKMLSRDVVETLMTHLKVEGWTFDIELILLSLAKGFDVKCIQVKWQDKSGSKLRPLEDIPTMVTDLCVLGTIYKLK